jgi:hypothetical protein
MSFGSSGSSNASFGRSFVDPKQQPFLQTQRRGAENQRLRVQPGLNQFASEGIGGLFQQGQAANEQLAGLAQLAQNDPIQGQALDSLANFSNQEALQGQIGNLGENLGQFFNEQLLPGIDATTQLAGQGIGSGRNAVARGQATRDTLNAFARGTADLNAQFGQQQIAASQGALAGRQGQLGLAGLLQQQGIGNLPGLAGLGLSQFTAPFAGLAEAANIIGSPTVLARNIGGGSSSGFNFGLPIAPR